LAQVVTETWNAVTETTTLDLQDRFLSSFLVVLLNAVENQLSDMPKGPKAREIAIGTLGLLIGTLQLAPAVDDPSLSKNILAAGTHVAGTLIQPGKRRT
jgi:hypothetical protein